MWSTERYPRIEAQWNPSKMGQKQKHQHAPSNDEASQAQTTITTNSGSSVEGGGTTTATQSPPRQQQDSVSDNHEQQQQPSRHHFPHLPHPKLRSLLAALSFEHHPKPVRKKKKHTKLLSSAKDSAATAATSPIDTSLVLRGTRVDSEEFDVFFDAEQYGDLSTDSFSLRDSVVLDGIKISPSSATQVSAVETELATDSHNDHQHISSNERTLPIHEDGNESTNHGSDEEYEYSENEYNERQESPTSSLSNEKSAPMGTDTTTDTSATTSATIPVIVNRSYQTAELIPDAVMTPPLVKFPPPPPPPPNELPLRFLRAGKNDPVEGLRRYEATLKMRKDQRIDTILREPSPDFAVIKQHYPHYCHRTGKNGEPCFYEQPPKTNLRALRDAGVTLDKLLRHYTMVTEFQWQYLVRDDLANSIYIIDLDGIRMTDFVGEAVDFVKKAAAFSSQHYPERAGYVFVINVPAWFKLIWNVIKPIVDADTLKKIYILRGKDEIRTAMQDRILLENIPPEYGGTSMPLGESPEEQELATLIAHNNTLAEQHRTVCATDCRFCKWIPARSY